jgi:hypothetical protein
VIRQEKEDDRKKATFSRAGQFEIIKPKGPQRARMVISRRGWAELWTVGGKTRPRTRRKFY